MTGAAGMRFSYATISLPTLQPHEAVAALADAGYGGIEWKVGEAAHAMRRNTAPTFLSGNRCTLHVGTTDPVRVREMCAEAGLEIVGLGPYLDIDNLAQLDEVMSFASACGAPQVRLQAPRPEHRLFDYADLADRTRRYLAAAEERGRQHGIRLVLELHHRTIAPSASSAVRLVGDRDPDWIGVIYDVGNLVWEGHEDHDLAFQVLGAYLAHVHLKNVAAELDPATGRWSYTWSPIDTGFVDVSAFLATLRAHGYEGWVSVEDLSTTRDPLAALHYNARFLANACG